MATLKVDTITSDTLPTVSLTDGLVVSGVTTMSNTVNVTSGRLLHGTTASRSIADGTPNVQVEGTAGTASLGLVRNQNNSGGSNISFAKSRGTSVGSATIVQDDDTLGNINFAAADGTDINTIAASIVAQVDGTPGANDMPGRLIFKTTADGANSATERLRITSAGYVGVGEASPATILHVKANVGDMLRLDRNNTGAVGNQIAFRHSASGTLTETGSINCVSAADAASGDLRFYTKASGASNAEKLRIDSAGDLGLGVAPNNFSSYRTLHIKGPSSGNGSAIRLEDHGDTADSDDFVIYKNSIAGYLRVNGTDPIIAYLNGGERIRIASAGQIGIGGANYGTSGQVLTSGGASAAVSWATASGGKLKGWAYGTTPSGTTGGATSSNKITLFTQAYTPTDANSTIIIYCWVNIDARTSSYSDRIRIQGVRDSTAQGARWLIHGSFGNSNGSILSLPYFYKPTGWTAGSSSTFKVELWSEGSSGTPSDQYNTRLHESGYYLLVELGS